MPRPFSLRDWADRIAQRRGRRIAAVALARRLAGILYAIWRDRSEYNTASLRGVVAATGAVGPLGGGNRSCSLLRDEGTGDGERESILGCCREPRPRWRHRPHRTTHHAPPSRRSPRRTPTIRRYGSRASALAGSAVSSLEDRCPRRQRAACGPFSASAASETWRGFSRCVPNDRQSAR